MMWRLFIFVRVFLFVNAQYEVPEATVEAFTPRGFRVYIPDEEGIRLFAFHGKINEELNGREAGTFSRDINQAKDGRWIFTDTATKLKVGDKIYYWTYVNFDGIGYPKDDQEFEVTELVPRPVTPKSTTTTTTTTTTTPKPQPKPTSSSGCEYSQTVYNGGKKVCKGKLIFSDSFNNVLSTKSWRAEQKFAGSPDYEFCIYLNRTDVLTVENKILKIKPQITNDILGNDAVTRPFDIGKVCTGVSGSPDCVVRPDAGFILPPIISAKLSTKKTFSFKYGKVEIRAKLPKGDWIYPELYLNSLNEDYGSNYESGQIRIAYTPGNDADSTTLYGGIVLGTTAAARTYGMRNIEKQTSWSKAFNKYTIVWKPDSIVMSVNDRIYGTIYPPAGGFSTLGTELEIKNANRWKQGGEMCPFDKEMYLVLGVGVGGFNFPEAVDANKPWKNGERLSLKKFYKAQEDWETTWDDDSVLQVDYVKVFAL